MFLMLLWACMLSSQLSPPNFSTVTLWTVPGSRQCGAIPAETNKKHSSHMNTAHYFHWTPVCVGTVVQNTMIIYSIINLNNGHWRADQSKQKNQCGRWCNMFTAHVTVRCLESYTISIRVGARCVETLNPTSLTERVLCNVSVKSVCGQIIGTLEGRETKKTSYSYEMLQCFN